MTDTPDIAMEAAEALHDIARGPLQEPQDFGEYAKQKARAALSSTPPTVTTDNEKMREAVRGLLNAFCEGPARTEDEQRAIECKAMDDAHAALADVEAKP